MYEGKFGEKECKDGLSRARLIPLAVGTIVIIALGVYILVEVMK